MKPDSPSLTVPSQPPAMRVAEPRKAARAATRLYGPTVAPMERRWATSLRNITKTFTLPVLRQTTLRDRVLHRNHPSAENRRIVVLDHVTLKIASGEWVGIIGRNGSGKTTLLRLIAGIYQPDSGHITHEGTIAPLLDLGMGFQNELSAEDNIFCAGALLGLPHRRLEERCEGVLQFAGVERFRALPLKHWSAGMRVRLAFSLLREIDADIYLLDEVFSVGDLWFQKQCEEVFDSWKERGKTVLLASHGLLTVQKWCTRVIWLERGRVTANASASAVITAYRHAPALHL